MNTELSHPKDLLTFARELRAAAKDAERPIPPEEFAELVLNEARRQERERKRKHIEVTRRTHGNAMRVLYQRAEKARCVPVTSALMLKLILGEVMTLQGLVDHFSINHHGDPIYREKWFVSLTDLLGVHGELYDVDAFLNMGLPHVWVEVDGARALLIHVQDFKDFMAMICDENREFDYPGPVNEGSAISKLLAA